MTQWTIHTGDVADILPEIAKPFDAVLCDPPYGLAFMGREWDHAVPGPAVWRAVLDVMRPGASLLACGGTRTFHRLTCAVEDAGLEVRDLLMWMYGSGFPKNYDISKGIDAAAATRDVVGSGANYGASKLTDGKGAHRPVGQASRYRGAVQAQRFDGYGTALKPAYEPIVWAMAPRDGSFANNATEHGVAGINIDAGRIETDSPIVTSRSVSYGDTGAAYGGGNGEYTVSHNDRGRWPANVILDETAGAMLDEQTGEYQGSTGSNALGGFGTFDSEPISGDSGGASRFFYCAKSSRAEREAGLHGFRKSNVNDGRQTSIDNAYQRGDTKRRNTHPTVKPVDLCRYLAAMLLPPRHEGGRPRRLLVPFSGSGSEMIGGLLAGWDEVVGIEMSPDYTAIAEARLAHWAEYRTATSERAESEALGQRSLLSLMTEEP